MSTLIKDVTPVTVTIDSFSVSGQNFSTPLIMGSAIRQEDRTQAFTSLAGMLAANYQTTDAEYIGAANMLAQTSKKGKKVTSFKIGKKYENVDAIEKIAWDASASSGTFTIDISKAGAAAVTSGSINYNDNAAAIKAVIDAMANVTSCTVTFNTGATQAGDAAGFAIEFDGDATIDFEITDADVAALVGVSSFTTTRHAYATAEETFTAGYNNIKAYDDDWHYLLPLTLTKADLLLLAAALESDTSPKFGFFGTKDADVPAATALNIAEQLQDSSYTKCCLAYTADTDDYPNLCWAGAVIPDKLWGINPCWYPLTSITGDTLTATQIGNLVDQNCNRIETIGSYTVVPGTAAGESGNVGGITPSGQFIDYIDAKDYLQARISEDLYTLLLNSIKIPFTKPGESLVQSTIIASVITYGVNEGIVEAGSITVDMPDLDTYSTTKKANRWLDGVVGDGTPQGAINKISVSFNLTV